MEYFELVQDTEVENPIKILGLYPDSHNYRMTEERFHSLDRLNVVFYSGAGAEETCGILTDPAFMVLDQVKRLFEAYDGSIQYKAVQVYPRNRDGGGSPLYWIPWIPESGCLHTECKRYGNGMIQELVLDGSRTGGRDILCIPDIVGRKLAVSLELAESLLRRGIYGIGLKKLEVL